MLSTFKLKELNICDMIKPKPRDGPALFCHNDRIYSFGGIDMNSKCLLEMWELNLSSRKWTKCELHTKSRANLG